MPTHFLGPISLGGYKLRNFTWAQPAIKAGRTIYAKTGSTGSTFKSADETAKVRVILHSDIVAALPLSSATSALFQIPMLSLESLPSPPFTVTIHHSLTNTAP
jgi:hypothetical protein